MTTATESILKRDDETRRKQVFEYMTEDFIRDWKPEEPRDQYQFEAQLISLIRQVYEDAQKPIFDQYNKLIMCLPTPFGLPK